MKTDSKKEGVFFPERKETYAYGETYKGYRIELYLNEKDLSLFNVCAYARLPNASLLKEGFFLGSESYREGDIVGTDTAHGWSHGWFSKEAGEAKQGIQHVTTALNMIRSIVDKHVEVFGEGKEARE